jgi:AraC family transcriptional regulator, transcriptional activator of pobA
LHHFANDPCPNNSKEIIQPLNNRIKRYTEVNQFFETTGFEKRTDIPEFFIFHFEELPKDSMMQMQPYQKGFYQISLILRSDNAAIAINEQQDATLENSLYFLSPDHIFSWQRNFETTGYIVYFKPAFLNFYNGSIVNDFSFFELTENNILKLTTQQSNEIAVDFEKLYNEFYEPNPYRIQLLQSFLLFLLFKCKSINELTNTQQIKPSKKHDLLIRFKNLVNNCFITNKQVSDYAGKLFVTPNYLNDTIKEQTGKTAKELISEKILSEAKKQLRYSTGDIAEIAFYLGYDEPTHFIRFFKSRTGITPNVFRNQNP